MNLTELLVLASKNELSERTAIEHARSHNLTLAQFANMFALALAQSYREQRYDFAFCDNAANWLFGFMTDETFLASNNNTLPSPAYDVYLAFDAGEYHHRGDDKDVVAEEKYTKPLILEILSRQYV
ncbi:hypothetical protein [Gynuella sunshinyii]|uniref:Uncharacterized protein n=1 Tax=Gynuella sunshinyii YC6258 TaxID=1445510 RepID=A0A0C5VJK1_9GAMM|nr:hypothetical protein [Gynuella sunshinyii]AJQ94822.1 hypothetical Protein YC6258_02784 [Gynuella sunshinyii YC6258]